MTPVPLDRLWLIPAHHRSALWWLGLLYRRPKMVHEALGKLPRAQQFLRGTILFLHASPHVSWISALGRIIVLSSLSYADLSFFEIAYQIAGWIAWGIAGGIAWGIAGGIALLRAYYYPAHLGFFWPKPRGRWYRFHPVAWDDLCALPFVGLHRLLVAYAESEPDAARAEIERLIAHYPSQRWEALKARTMLGARAAGAEIHLGSLDARVADLPQGEKGFLAETSELRTLIGEITQVQRRLDTMDRPAFREPVAANLVTTIENFRHRIAGFHEPLASEFHKAAVQWQAVAEKQLQDIRAVVAREPSPQVFRAGDPVNRAQEAFVPRMLVIEELEGQIMLATGCPRLLLYGRRRMGKSTLLRNLDGFLPASLRIVSISMQNPRAFAAVSSLIGLIAEHAGNPVEKGARPADPPGDLPGLFNFLSGLNQGLEKQDRRLILALDEYEQVDEKIGEGVFTTDLLSAVRESVQSHRRIIWIFAGSHHISELGHANWPSFFVSLRTVDLGPFSEEETRLLLTEPLKSSPLWQSRETERPCFDPAFWGEGGIERIHQEAGGWPHLVQLIAETVVDLANQRGASSIDAALLGEACETAARRGDTVFRTLLEGENRFPEEWDYLLAFRDRESQPPPTHPDVRQSLRRRLLVIEEGRAWRLRAPLMRRWLVANY